MLSMTVMDDFPGMVIVSPAGLKLLNGRTVHMGGPSVASVVRVGRTDGTPAVQ